MSSQVQIALLNKKLIYILIFVAIFFVIAARRPDILLHPQLWAEDGKIWLSGAYNQGIYSFLLPQNGYYQTISRLTFSIGLLFGLSKAALVANIIAISIRCCLVMFILSSRISFIHISYRIAAVIYFLFMPNLSEGYVNITNVQWYLSIYLFMIIFADDAESFSWKLHDYIVLIIAALSGPFVIFLSACLFIKRVAQWGGIINAVKRINYFDIIMVICFVIQALAIILTVSSHARSSAPLGASFSLLIKILSTRIVLGTFFSNDMVFNFASKECFVFFKGWLSFALMFVVMISICKAIISSGWRFWISVIFPSLIIGFTLANPMMSLTEDQWPTFLIPGGGERYFFITNFAFFCFILFIISQMGKFSQALLSCLMICIVPLFFLNFSIPPLAHVGFREDIKKFDLLPKGQEMSIRINPQGWQMDLKKK
ncbi:hypothetical protein [Commensalibacter papalotli (ex Botero et al. 2024)]|uniref:Glucosyl transferase n=1 Tax=Commensalibacter papalotli (ex Botero et al. 2024) TaxID=2972766 RepID=A0ABN8W641_9PROT|nr:hypothetical protein [Commensalibacter papalotli (ex Botero et al. 2024)]CAI3924348.1 unnamed protein product [Commensalibacter papalotli (ex Botero et al. 2024)]CAI3927711.1 unnamed protein product [Commensalibacter papalotli (ex Botero et al. 2024)]